MAAQKVALITAGTAGLGAQIARVLAPDFRLVSPPRPALTGTAQVDSML
jgi:NAD(P)-dependent dehydrogenase (short-subunit alcohol dehydrogenase family)